MALIDDVRGVCRRLKDHGWATLLGKHGLDITKSKLREELDRPLGGVDRTVPGFEDFAAEGGRGIEPGDPNRSLLYHALASPDVLQVDGVDLTAFPTLRELDVVENYVFAARPRSLPELSVLAAGDLMAVVVFASEYRPAGDTVHRKHAALCFSRTGVARVGNQPAHYDARRRGFTPFARDVHAFRVLPARYSAWIAVQRSGSESSFGPMRFSFRAKHPELYRRGGDPADPADTARKFWVPLHKLFGGPECLQGFDLAVGLDAHHVNEKLRRIHLEFLQRGYDGGWARPDIDRPPFRFSDRIAVLADAATFGPGLLVPVHHPTLVEAAADRGTPVTFLVPTPRKIRSRGNFAPTLEISSLDDRARHAPEYVHVRHAVGSMPANLNTLTDPAARVRQGGYRAQHYVDFTADGWIAAVCPQLAPHVPRSIAAYSIVAAPDFYPACDQREVMDWWLERAPTALRDFLWDTPPLTLADERVAPNLKLNNVDLDGGDPSIPRAGFRPEDDTVTAIVSLPVVGAVQARPLGESRRTRHSWLPDAAAGYFAPGWDTSFDVTGGVLHLAAYGLGSPFPEDSKLCAALSTFWPATAPDAGRSFSLAFPTVSPLTDEELGQAGKPAWDGVPGPRVVTKGGVEKADYASFDHVDYVENALANRFSLALTGKVDTREYVARVLAMARAYRAVGVTTVGKKDDWNVLSFRRLKPGDPDLREAKAKTGEALGGEMFRFELYQPGSDPSPPDQQRRSQVAMKSRAIVLVGGTPTVLVKSAGRWDVRHV